MLGIILNSKYERLETHCPVSLPSYSCNFPTHCHNENEPHKLLRMDLSLPYPSSSHQISFASTSSVPAKNDNELMDMLLQQKLSELKIFLWKNRKLSGELWQRQVLKPKEYKNQYLSEKFFSFSFSHSVKTRLSWISSLMELQEIKTNLYKQVCSLTSLNIYKTKRTNETRKWNKTALMMIAIS